MTQQPTTRKIPATDTYLTLDQAKGYICAVEHNHPGYDGFLDDTRIRHLAKLHGYQSGPALEAWLQGYQNGFMDANRPYELVATMEELEQTAHEFGWIVVAVPQKDVVVLIDQTMMDDGSVKQFWGTPEGRMRARRWAVTMDEEEEVSASSFAQLKAANLAMYYHLDRHQ